MPCHSGRYSRSHYILGIFMAGDLKRIQGAGLWTAKVPFLFPFIDQGIYRHRNLTEYLHNALHFFVCCWEIVITSSSAEFLHRNSQIRFHSPLLFYEKPPPTQRIKNQSNNTYNSGPTTTSFPSFTFTFGSSRVSADEIGYLSRDKKRTVAPNSLSSISLGEQRVGAPFEDPVQDQVRSLMSGQTNRPFMAS